MEVALRDLLKPAVVEDDPDPSASHNPNVVK